MSIIPPLPITPPNTCYGFVNDFSPVNGMVYAIPDVITINPTLFVNKEYLVTASRIVRVDYNLTYLSVNGSSLASLNVYCTLNGVSVKPTNVHVILNSYQTISGFFFFKANKGDKVSVKVEAKNLTSTQQISIVSTSHVGFILLKSAE